MGEASGGAGIIFGSTGGGVMEAALRTAYEWISGQELTDIEFNEIRAEEYKDAEIQMGEHRIKVAVARGTGAARRLIEAVLKGEKEYHFVEVMACPPAGCVGGGGQPIYIETNDWNEQVSHRAMRTRGFWSLIAPGKYVNLIITHPSKNCTMSFWNTPPEAISPNDYCIPAMSHGSFTLQKLCPRKSPSKSPTAIGSVKIHGPQTKACASYIFL